MSKYNNEIITELEKIMKIKRSSIIKNVERMKKSYLAELKFSITTEIVFLILALEKGIDISKYEEKVIVQEVTDWHIKIERKKTEAQTKEAISKDKDVKRKKMPKKKLSIKNLKSINVESDREKIRIDNNIYSISYIPNNIINEIIPMTNIYSWVYLFENSVRNVIIKKMFKHGENWWNTELVSRKIRDKIKNRKKEEEKQQWHRGKRNTHSIYYTDLSDLNKIIKNNWCDFIDIFHSQDFVGALFDSVELSRNIIAHNNPLPKAEKDDLKKDIKRWFRQIEGRI